MPPVIVLGSVGLRDALRRRGVRYKSYDTDSQDLGPSETQSTSNRPSSLRPALPIPLLPHLRPSRRGQLHERGILQGRMSSILILGSCFIACLALRAVAQDAPIIFSNQGLLKDWPSESYASTAYSSEFFACLHAQVTYSRSPRTPARLGLPVPAVCTSGFSRRDRLRRRDCSARQPTPCRRLPHVRGRFCSPPSLHPHFPAPHCSHWSITKIAVPLRRTSISTVTDLSNYQIVFYQDSGSLAPA